MRTAESSDFHRMKAFTPHVVDKVLHPVVNIRKTRRNVIEDRTLTASVIVEKVRKRNGGGTFVNNRYYPKYYKYGYRFQNLRLDDKAPTMTIEQMRELHYNLGEFLKSQKE